MTCFIVTNENGKFGTHCLETGLNYKTHPRYPVLNYEKGKSHVYTMLVPSSRYIRQISFPSDTKFEKIKAHGTEYHWYVNKFECDPTTWNIADLTVFKEFELHRSNIILNQICSSGSLENLIYFYENYRESFNQQYVAGMQMGVLKFHGTLDYAIINGHMQIIKFFYELNQRDGTPFKYSKFAVTDAINAGHILVEDFFKQI